MAVDLHENNTHLFEVFMEHVHRKDVKKVEHADKAGNSVLLRNLFEHHGHGEVKGQQQGSLEAVHRLHKVSEKVIEKPKAKKLNEL